MSFHPQVLQALADDRVRTMIAEADRRRLLSRAREYRRAQRERRAANRARRAATTPTAPATKPAQAGESAGSLAGCAPHVAAPAGR